MLIPLAHTVAKRLFGVRGRALHTWLTLRISVGLVGAILAVLHTGHKFDNPIGVLLTAMTLGVVVSGIVGRYLLQHTTRHLTEMRGAPARLQPVFDAVQQEAATQMDQTGLRKTRWEIVLGMVLPWSIRDRQLRMCPSAGTAPRKNGGKHPPRSDWCSPSISA